MRISDWSSDVCSSDLFGRRGRNDTAIAVIIANQARIIGERLGIRTVGTKRLSKLFCHAIFVFSGGDMDHITLPARSGLDAEQVENGGRQGERRAGKECVGRCSCRWSTRMSKINQQSNNIKK